MAIFLLVKLIIVKFSYFSFNFMFYYYLFLQLSPYYKHININLYF
ncbi:Hypothetical protein I595_2411 [Croceitalea dokdonensis DOKDO 023]|uniref:Uncharacterized protein n=1 Tax=Croceitalea dokdonensis DOKDO 023 TaxID=1300341 RepID=A0A0N8H3P5_9FLAO|nr:Hypothetical protein I595_2411 [Croceitalea dokdonensis DOKDO 023]